MPSTPLHGPEFTAASQTQGHRAESFSSLLRESHAIWPSHLQERWLHDTEDFPQDNSISSGGLNFSSCGSQKANF